MTTPKRIVGKIVVTDRFLQDHKQLVACITKQYSRRMATGLPLSQAKVLEAQVIDEIQLVLSTDVNNPPLESFHSLIHSVAITTSTPLAVGASIASYSHARHAFESGADKIIIRSDRLLNSPWIPEIIRRYGKQSVVASIDYRPQVNGYVLSGSSEEYVTDLTSYVDSVARSNRCGEIAINDISLDGEARHVFQNPLLVQYTLDIPLLVGCGFHSHETISQALSQNYSGVILSTFLIKSDQSVQQIKARLINLEHSMRLY